MSTSAFYHHLSECLEGQRVWRSSGYQRSFIPEPCCWVEGAGSIRTFTSEICSCGFGPTDTSYRGVSPYTPHGAHRLMPRLEFTFAPSRLNSHLSSSHNTSLPRDMKIMGFLLPPHAKYEQRLILSSQTVFLLRHE